MRTSPLLSQWIDITDALAAACAERGAPHGAYAVLVEIAGGMILNGAEDGAEVVELATRSLDDQARLAELIAGRATRDRERLESLVCRAHDRARSQSGRTVDVGSAKRRGSPNAVHRSNKRAPQQRWDFEADE